MPWARTRRRIFCRHYGVEEVGNAPAGSDPHGEFKGKNILLERQDIDDDRKDTRIAEETVSKSLATGRAMLFEQRAKRPRPHLDDKILTAWNGLMISAFSKAGAALREPRYLEAAQKAANFLRSNLTAQGGLLRSWRGEPGSIAGFAEDYAFLIQGLLDLYQADWDSRLVEMGTGVAGAPGRPCSGTRREAAISAARPATRWFPSG